jgi:hypothetical protein
MKKIRENAAAGTTSAHSIAVRTDGNRLGGDQHSFRRFLGDFYKKVQNRGKFHQVAFESSIKACKQLSEGSDYPFQLTDAQSRLKGIQMKSEFDDRDTISFGVEDDDGNFMKLTVPANQAKEFETKVAQSLAEVQEFKRTGRGNDRSLAELLYELKDQFTILDADFPTIPKNAIYMASQLDEDPDDNDQRSVDDNEEDAGDEGGDDPLGDLDNMDASTDADDPEGAGEEGESPDLDALDDDMGEDFDSGGSSKEAMLDSIIKMITSNNEREIEQYKAEQEKAKAEQMKLANMRAERKQSEAEEMIAAEAEMEKEKKQDKEAKRMLDVMKFKMESPTPIFDELLKEAMGNLEDTADADDPENPDVIDSEEDARDIAREAQKKKMANMARRRNIDPNDQKAKQYIDATNRSIDAVARAKQQAANSLDQYKKSRERKQNKEGQ